MHIKVLIPISRRPLGKPSFENVVIPSDVAGGFKSAVGNGVTIVVEEVALNEDVTAANIYAITSSFACITMEVVASH